MMVLDTDVFIDHFRGQEAANAYSHRLPADQRATTDITVMDLDKGAANQQELATILRLLTHNRVTRLPVSPTASQRAVELVHQYGLAHGLGIPEALIAAMTLEGAHTLVTDNVRHFRFIPGYTCCGRHTAHPRPPPSGRGPRHPPGEEAAISLTDAHSKGTKPGSRAHLSVIVR